MDMVVKGKHGFHWIISFYSIVLNYKYFIKVSVDGLCMNILRELLGESSQLFTLDLEGRMGLEVMEGLEGLDGRVVLRFVIGATENMSSSISSPNNGSATIK